MDFVEMLTQEQKKLNLSDRGFARYLGVSSTLWILTKRRKLEPGHKLMAAAVQRFPLLSNSVIHQLNSKPVGASRS